MAAAEAAERAPLDVELSALRVGSCVLLTFPGELSSEIGLELKARRRPLWLWAAGRRDSIGSGGGLRTAGASSQAHAASTRPQLHTFVSCYTNGYIFYAPTESQLANCCTAQEDCDCMVAPGWRSLYEEEARAMLAKM